MFSKKSATSAGITFKYETSYICNVSQLVRLISILTQLRSKRLLTAKELAEKYEVSIRTIYRDIKKLEEAGVPVITIEGRGYTLMDGYTVAPVHFTEEEANALITAEHLVLQTGEESFQEHFGEAMTKIKSVFRSSIQEKSEYLSSQMYVFKKKDEGISSNVLSQFQLAITNQKLVAINYQKVYTGEQSFRKVEPYAFYSSNDKWILIAWCHLRLDYRAFRIDKIQHFQIMEDGFEHRGFNLQDYFKEDTYDGEHGQK